MYFSIINKTKYLIKINKYKNKFLFKKLKKTGGRNNYGRITSFHHGGGHKKKYRIIKFNYLKNNFTILSKEYDPNRSSFISLCKDLNNKFFYILLPQNLDLNTILNYSTELKNCTIGNFSKLKNIPIATPIHNLEIKPNQGGKLIRAAGTFGQIMKLNTNFKNYLQIKLPSGQLKLFHKNCIATIGKISNLNHKYLKLKKAGNSRWLGIKPTVRGVAMNPIDHPHGGGQGKTSGGRPSVTPWGILTKGYPTIRSKKKKLF